MHIGLIGGIGVTATVAYYQRLTQAAADLGVAPDLTIVHADAATLIRNTLADNREVQADIYCHLIDRLKAAGADCAAITSLGGHFCFDETVARTSLPLVSAVRPLDAYFAEQGYDTVGLLGTSVVMQTRLYGQLQNTKAVILDKETDTLGARYFDMAVARHCDAKTRALFLDAGARLIRDKGAQAVVLAGTDLSLAFDGQRVDYPVIDALDVHVDLLGRLAAGQVPLAEVT
ncbi:MAG: aspartate/glutamate racemase family protein [Arenibacterium sp.]